MKLVGRVVMVKNLMGVEKDLFEGLTSVSSSEQVGRPTSPNNRFTQGLVRKSMEQFSEA